MRRVLPNLALAMALCAPLPGAAQTSGALALLGSLPDVPMISYVTIGRLTAITPADVFEIEIASSGGLTDIFIRLAPPASAELADWTTLAEGFRLTLSLCAANVLEVESLTVNTSGTLYVPNLTFVQADALRAVWHGRETCSTLPPEVFPIGQ